MCSRTPPTARLKPLYNFMKDLPSIGGTPIPFLPHRVREAHRRHQYQLRRRPRLPVPVLVLHHHQRAGPQVALSLARRHREDRARELGAGHLPLLHHRRQFCPQQGVGSDLRPARQAARGRQDSARPDDPGRHDVPQDPELHREGEARRRDARVHRARERQPGQSGRRQEEAEQDHRIPQDAARLEGAGHLRLCRLHPRLPRRHAGIDPARHRDHSARAAARHSGVHHPHAAARLGGSPDPVAEGRRHGRRSQQVRPRACRHRPSEDDPGGAGGDLSGGRGRSTTRRRTSRRCCGGRW